MFTVVKKGLIYGIIGLVLLGSLILLCNYWVLQNGKGRVFAKAKEIPVNDVALVLGTNPLLRGKYVNLYFKYRIEAATKLYQEGKVKHFIVSGDNSRKTYDEPSAMRDSLVAAGIPFDAITLDYAGFRTLDSVVRCKEIFQQEKITIISQEFHNYRALLIANQYGMDAIAYNAEQPYPTVRTKVQIREYFARCKAILDLYILNKQPKFLGEKIELKIKS